MSFQLNTATALPSEVQLGKEKPQGAFCLRSRYALSANTASSWNAGTTLSIPLQTGTPGTFTDVKQGIIQATLEIFNTNPYVDFLNFGPSGAMIFFDEMRIYSSGTPIEENLRYSETADLLHTQPGHQIKPFHVYRRNKWRANSGLAGHHHINFIKPSMVDCMGVPMFGRTPLLDKNSAVYHPASYQIGNLDTDFTSVDLTNATGGGAQSFAQIPEGTPFADFGNQQTAAPQDVTVLATTTGSSDNTLIKHRKGRPLAPSFLYAPSSTLIGRGASTVASAARQVARYTPALWPDYQPSTLNGEFDDDEIDSLLGKTKMSEYFKYLSNLRSLPIGVRGSDTEGPLGVPNQPSAQIGTYQFSAPLLAPASGDSGSLTAARYMQYRVSMPFLSGIYGIFAEKMFPDMLIGANNIRIEFKLAQNAKALWLTMDPCRRVPGTLRDFVPFAGQKSNTTRRPDDAATIVQLAAASSFSCTYRRTYIPQAADWAADSSFIANASVYNSEACLGKDFSSPILVGQGVRNNANAIDAAALLAFFAPEITAGSAQICGSYLLYQEKDAAHYRQLCSEKMEFGVPLPQVVPTSNPWCKGNAFGVSAGNAAYPHPIFCNENASCFGTYLPASQPQSRRTTPATRLKATTDNFSNAGQTYFRIRDIQYIGEQVQLDDVVTSAIIQSAASSEIVVWTRGYRSFEASCEQNTQQNIILPIQIGQAEAMYLLFRAPIVTQSTDYYSNSFVCPFTGLSFDNQSASVKALNNGEIPDVGGAFQIQSSLDTGGTGAFSYQLFSGTKQYPLQPIQTVSELISEREKSVHALHNWDWDASDSVSLMNWGTSIGNRNSSYGLDYDPFIDSGYFTTFVPVLALDDQTITQNPYLQVAEVGEIDSAVVAEALRIRGRRCPTTTVVESTNNGATFTGVLNEFTVPIGTFYLGWDFESWTNHQDVMRTGKFLGQEQVSIRMTGTFLCTAKNVLAPGQIAQGQNIMCTAIVPHVVKLSFIPGGHLLSYY